MTEDDIARANFWNESAGHCDCCGKQSKTVWGDLSDSSGTKAVYFVHCALDCRRTGASAELRPDPGTMGDGAAAEDRVLVSLVYHPRPGGGSFMVISGKGRRADDRGLCGRALERDDVIGTPLAAEVFSLVDALWLTEPASRKSVPCTISLTQAAE